VATPRFLFHGFDRGLRHQWEQKFADPNDVLIKAAKAEGDMSPEGTPEARRLPIPKWRASKLCAARKQRRGLSARGHCSASMLSLILDGVDQVI
jgi:hypothetical protein